MMVDWPPDISWGGWEAGGGEGMKSVRVRVSHRARCSKCRGWLQIKRKAAAAVPYFSPSPQE